MRLKVPAEKKFVYEALIPIRWGDMDAMGHVNNTLYFRYFQIVRMDWFFRAVGSSRPQDEGVLIVNSFCNFIRQLEYPGEVRARLFVANAGRSSFDTFMTLERSDEPGVLYADGGATTVWIDHAAKKSKSMPDWFRAQLL